MDDRCPLAMESDHVRRTIREPGRCGTLSDRTLCEVREQFLKEAQANGYSPRTLMRMAWALLVVAEIVRDAGGSITPERLRSALHRQVKSKWAGPSTIPTYH